MIKNDTNTKAIGQFRLQVNGVLSVFDMHGMGVYTPEVTEAVVQLALKLHHRLNGEDVPIQMTKVDNGHLMVMGDSTTKQ